MSNKIELITKYSSKAWDKVYKREAISSVLDVANDLLKFTGAKTVKIARFNVSGLSDYHRPNTPVAGVFGGDGHDTGMAQGYGYGYQQGDAALVWEEFTLSMDRAVQLRIELMDDEETDGLAVAAATQEVSRTQVVPEVDAYVFSKIAEYADKGGTVITQNITPAAPLSAPQAGNPIFELNAAFLALAEAEVPEDNQIIFCSNAFYNAIRNTGEIVKTLRQTEYKENVRFTIGEYEGRTIVAVPANRFKTGFKALQGGYGWASGSKNINFIVCAKDAITHVTKYDKVKVYAPGVVQDFDGYKVNVRVYHDVFVPTNKCKALYVCLANDATAAVTSERSMIYSFANNTITGVTISPNGDLVRALYASQSQLAIGSKVASDAAGSTEKGFIAVNVPITGLDADPYYLYGVDNGEIVSVGANAAGGATFTIVS